MDIPPPLPLPTRKPRTKTAKPKKPRAKPKEVDPNIPLYSYRTEPYPSQSTTPTVIYTRHEEEANELCSGLLARATKTDADG